MREHQWKNDNTSPIPVYKLGTRFVIRHKNAEHAQNIHARVVV